MGVCDFSCNWKYNEPLLAKAPKKCAKRAAIHHWAFWLCLTLYSEGRLNINGYSSCPVTIIILPLTSHWFQKKFTFYKRHLSKYFQANLQKKWCSLTVFNKQDTEKDLTKKRKKQIYEKQNTKVPPTKDQTKCPQCKERWLLLARCLTAQGGSGLGKGENLDGGYWTRIWVQVLPRLQ